MEVTMNKLRVLIVDDHDGFRKMLVAFLKSHSGVDAVFEATDGNDAIEMVARCRPDLVLMDIHMPNCNGIDATRTIKVLNPGTLVVMMSMDSTEEYERSARLLADGYIPKSSMKKPLLSLIADCSSAEVEVPVMAAA